MGTDDTDQHGCNLYPFMFINPCLSVASVKIRVLLSVHRLPSIP